MSDEEVWRKIDGFSHYEISNFGRVKCILRKNNAYNNYYKSNYIMKDFDNKGYRKIQLTNDEGKKITITVHRLVAMAFIPNPNNLPQVNHKDGNKQNNHVDNLEWCTNKENVIHSINTGLRKTKLGKVMPKKEKLSKEALHNLQVETLNKNRYKGIEKNKIYNSKKVAQCDLDGKIIKIYYGIREASRKTGINRQNIIAVCKGKRKIIKGFIWRYYE